MSYQYDALNRLIHAETADAAWGTTYAYDGWGNLTDKSLTKGSAPVMHTVYDPTLNMVAGSAAPNVVPQGYFSDYDVEDRPLNGNAGIWTGMSGRMTYDHSGKKVFWLADLSNPGPGDPQSKCEMTFYGIAGQKLARYKCWYNQASDESPNLFNIVLQDRTQHVGGELTSSDGAGVTTDRLGSIRAKDNGERYTYYPYGEAKTESVSGGGMYAGLESPVRNYVATMGRFDRPDPLGLRAVRMGDPGSWNRFAYTGGDPVNFVDPEGLSGWSVSGLNFCKLFPMFCQSGPYDPADRDITGHGKAPIKEPNSETGGYGGRPRPDCPPLPALPSNIGAGQIQKNIDEAHSFFDTQLRLDPEGALLALGAFLIDHFRIGGEWDYKKNYAQNTIDQRNARIFGNFDFGAVLESFDLSYKFTQSAAGIEQIGICLIKGGKRGSCGRGTPFVSYPYGDQPEDAADIQKGFDYEAAKRANCK